MSNKTDLRYRNHNTICGYCSHRITPHWRMELVTKEDFYCTYLLWGNCPNCEKLNVEIDKVDLLNPSNTADNKHKIIKIHPASKPKEIVAPNDVPPVVAKDYNEARASQGVSIRASAALARRCLESILEDQGYKKGMLAEKIDALLKENDPEKILPKNLRMTIDVIRNVGVFAAHPKADLAGKIYDVKDEEAEWCLEILDLCFDHFYVQPARDAERIEKLNKKLGAVGKPAIKDGNPHSKTST